MDTCGDIHIFLKVQSNSTIKEYQIAHILYIYYDKYTVGFIEISDIFCHHNQKNVSISYAIHKKARRKGYMQTALRETSDLLLEQEKNIDGIILSIDPANILSKNVAKKAGFIENKEWSMDYHSGGYKIYQKKRK